MRKMFRISVVLLAAIMGSACSLAGMSAREPVASYLLAPPVLSAQPAHTVRCASLGVVLAQPAPGFASRRMAYQREAYRLDYFAFAQWVDTLPRMVLPATVSALEGSGLFAQVLPGAGGVSAALQLRTDELSVLQIFSDDEADSQLRVRLRATLLGSSGRDPLGTWPVEATAAAPANPQGGVAAANEAFAQAFEQLIQHLASAVQEQGLCAP